jgi:hypothetical protein
LIHRPLHYQNERVEKLILAPRAPGESFSPADTKLINIIAQQAGVAAYTVRVNNDLQRSRVAYYLFALGVGFISGSSLLTLYVLLGLIPAHLFFLRFFEELELELRLGESYKEYKEKTPFLIPRLSAR